MKKETFLVIAVALAVAWWVNKQGWFDRFLKMFTSPVEAATEGGQVLGSQAQHVNRFDDDFGSI